MRARLLCATLLLALLTGLAGCGRRPAAPKEEAPPSSAVGEMKMGGSVIRVADPEGRWRFEARSNHIQAEGVSGPYLLRPANCWYQEAGKPRVLIRADSARVDRQAQRVLLLGRVRISYGGWLLEAERVEYNLKQGKVTGSGRTKIMVGSGVSSAEE